MADHSAAPKESSQLEWIGWVLGWALMGASIGVIVINSGMEFHVDRQTGELALTDVPRSQFFSTDAAWVSIFASLIPFSFLLFPRKFLLWLLAIGVVCAVGIAVASTVAAGATTASDWLAIAYVALLLAGISLMSGSAPRAPRALPGWAPSLAAGAVAATIAFLATPYIGKLALGERLDMNAAARTVLDVGAGAGFAILYAPFFFAIVIALALGAAALIVLAQRLGRKSSGDGSAPG